MYNLTDALIKQIFLDEAGANQWPNSCADLIVASLVLEPPGFRVPVMYLNL